MVTSSYFHFVTLTHGDIMVTKLKQLCHH